MAEKITLEFDINANKADLTLGELRDGMKELETALEGAGRGTKEFKELSTAMAQTNREIKNMELSFEALDNEQVASEIGSVAGGIGDVTASLVLLGGENETMQEMAASIEKAMAISMGFKGAIEGVSSGMKLYNNLLKQGKIQVLAKAAAEKLAAAGTWILNVANKALNTTLKMNPIGLIVIAITAVVGAIIYFKDAIWGLIESALKPFQFIIDILIDGLQAMGIMATDEAIAQEEAAKKAVEAAEERIKAAEELRRVHKETRDSMIRDLDFEMAKRKIAGEDFAELQREKIELLLEGARVEAKVAADNQAVIDKTIESLGVFGKQYGEIQDKVAQKAKDTSIALQQAQEDLVLHDLETKKAQEEAAKKWEDGREAREKAAFEKRKEEDALKVAQMESFSSKEVEIIDTKIEGLKKVEAVEIMTAENILAAKLSAAATEEKLANEADERRQKQLDLAQGALDVLSAGADAFIKDEVKREKVKKKLAIAQLAIDTARSISSVIAAAASTSITPIDLAIKIAAGLATVLSNVAQAKALLGAPSTSASSLGSAGASSSSAGGGVPINPVSNTSTIVGDQQAVVEVVEINKFQKKVGVIEASATY